ncbi:MAG: phage holin family protein [Alloprevotella sp.]|nr:phage holin family protein [Alloprevotella sp.]
MFSTDRNAESIRQLFLDFKEYLELRGRSAQLTLVEKLTVAASACILGAVLFVLAAFVLLFLSGMGVALLAPGVGGTAVACALVAAFYLLLALVVWLNRRRWIVNPVTTFLANLVLDLRRKATGDGGGPL